MFIEQIFVIFLLISIVVSNGIQLVSISNRFLTDGADLRVPYIVFSYIFNIFLIIFLIRFFTVSSVSSLLIFFIVFYYNLFLSITIKGRLLGYHIARISYKIKNLIYIVYSLIFAFLLLFGISDFSLFIYRVEEIYYEEYIKLFVLGLQSLFTTRFLIFFIVTAVLSCSINFIFDILERNVKKNIVVDIINLYPLCFILLVAFNIVTCFTAIFIMSIIYLLTPLIEIYKETFSIIKHSKGIDSRISNINKILKEIDFDKEISSKHKFQLSYIKRIFESDAHAKELCLTEGLFNKNTVQKIKTYMDNS